MDSTLRKAPTLLQALVPVGVLIGFLAASVYLFGDGSSQGPNQIALMLSAGVGIVIGVGLGYPWKELERGIVRGISLSMGAMLILLVVGALIGTWILSGVVPTMIYYGLKTLSPSVFYAAACLICVFVSIATGSSWTTASTIGIALVGVATAQDLNLGLTAGAIISGAYFGDKMSPLSDTTNLAPAVAGTELFVHIRHMMWTTVPSLIVALVGFAAIGWMSPIPEQARDLDVILAALADSFVIGPLLLLPAALVLFLVWRRMPAFPALLIGALVGAVFAFFFQPRAVLAFVGETDLPRGLALVKGCWTALFAGFTLSSGNQALDDLLSRGGVANMLNTVWLILSAMMFGAVLETTKMLEKLAASVLSLVSSTGTLIAATLASSATMNVIASDQYIAIVLPGRMFRAEYRRRRLHPKNLSRALEDAGTLTSPLIPWNTCGAFMAGTLGVPAFTYLPYCFFNLLNPLVSAAYGFTGFTIEPLREEDEDDEEAA